MSSSLFWGLSFSTANRAKPCKRAKHQHDDDWPFKLTLAQFELYLELQEKGEFSMLELPSRRPDAPLPPTTWRKWCSTSRP